VSGGPHSQGESFVDVDFVLRHIAVSRVVDMKALICCSCCVASRFYHVLSKSSRSLSKDILAWPASPAVWRMQDVVPLRELGYCSQRGNNVFLFRCLPVSWIKKLTHACLFGVLFSHH